ncbi:delta-60 repeat domain-containing protein, partial [Klebsiella aerogenes]|uniref:delta-60 repeat domain-containing protein n=1 Tax=Klebsiella aerogenes TaxID=548 RepID=UPI001CC43317|nr:delta-60 repeat domain-containing protein [Klebsiella aerogenes]
LFGSFKRSDGGDCRGLARLHADGSLDTTFRPLCTDAWLEAGLVRAILAADGMILVGFNVFDEVSGKYRSRLIRLKSDGSQDAELPAPDWR